MTFFHCFLLSCCMSIVTTLLYQWLFHKPHVVFVNDEGWEPIATLPDEDVLRLQRIIVTDGKEVECCWGVTYDRQGRVIMGYDKKIATHWRLLPHPPRIIK